VAIHEAMGAEVTEQSIAAQAAQRRADAAGENTERGRRHLRDLEPGSDRGGLDSARPAGTEHARDQAARMHDSAASMHDEAVRLGIGDSDEHRRSAARHREAADAHRPHQGLHD
jgi:hypothetical protein